MIAGRVGQSWRFERIDHKYQMSNAGPGEGRV